MNKQTLTILTTVLTIGLSTPALSNDIPVYTAQPQPAQQVNESNLLKQQPLKKGPLENKNSFNTIEPKEQQTINPNANFDPNQTIEKEDKDLTYDANNQEQTKQTEQTTINPNQKETTQSLVNVQTNGKQIQNPNPDQGSKIENPNDKTNIAVEKVTSGAKIEKDKPENEYVKDTNPNNVIDKDQIETKVTLEKEKENTYTPQKKLDVVEKVKVTPKGTSNIAKAKVDTCEQLNTVCYITQTGLSCYDETNKESMGGFSNVTIKDLDFDKKNPNLYLLNNQNNVFVVTTANKNADGYDVVKAFMDGNDVSGDINHISFAGGALYVSTTENIIYKMDPTSRAIEELYVLPSLSVEIKDILAHDTPEGTNLYYVDDEGTLMKVDRDGVATKVAEDVTDAPGQIAQRRIETNLTLFVSDEDSGDVIRINPSHSSVGIQTTFDELAHIHSTIDNRVLVVAQSSIKELLVTQTVTPDSLAKTLTDQAFKAAQGRICKINPKQTLTKPESNLKGTIAPGVIEKDSSCVNPNMVYDKNSGECICPEGYDEIPGLNGPRCELATVEEEDKPKKFDFADNSSEEFEQLIDPSSQEATPDESNPTAYGLVGGACTLDTSRTANTNGLAAFGFMMLGFALVMASKRQRVRVKSKK